MQERRRRRRFPIQQPISLRVKEETNWRELRGISEDASEEGVLLLAGSSVPEGAEVELTLTLPPGLQLFCVGRVVRVERGMNGSKHSVAVQCTRPLQELTPIPFRSVQLEQK